MKKRDLEEEINSFLERWNCDKHMKFLFHSQVLLELFDVDEDDDWVVEVVGEDSARNVRLFRTVYLVSRLADACGRDLLGMSIEFKGLWKRMEKLVKEVQNGQKDQKATDSDKEASSSGEGLVESGSEEG